MHHFGLLGTTTALLGLASACNHTLEIPPPCNPLLEPSCFARNPALSGCLHHRFSAPLDRFTATTCPSGLSYTEEGLTLTLRERFDNPSLTSAFYILHGKVEAEVCAAKGRGVISSFYLHSDDLDEIDIAEIFGGDPFEFQSNYFVKGNTTTYDRGGYHPMGVSPVGNFHTYAVEWTPEHVVWYLNGQERRVIRRDNPQGMPSSPMRLTFSLWAGGDPSNKEGTIQWAGGPTDYAQLPFEMHVRSVRVCDYSLGTEYLYGNRAGEWVAVGEHEKRPQKPVLEESPAEKATISAKTPSPAVSDTPPRSSPARISPSVTPSGKPRASRRKKGRFSSFFGLSTEDYDGHTLGASTLLGPWRRALLLFRGAPRG